MKPYRLAYFSATATEIPSLSQGIINYREKGGGLNITAKTRSQLFDDSRIRDFVGKALKSDMVFVTLHGGKASCPAFDELAGALDEKRENGEKVPYFHIQPVGNDEDALFLAEKYADGFGTEAWHTINKYYVNGGAINFSQMFIYIGNILFQESEPLLAPQKLPQEGIYHPDFPHLPSLEEYLEKKVDPDKLIAGIWFYQTYWLNNNVEHIDAIIREIERQGACVIPVFHIRQKDVILGNHGADYIAEKFFMRNESSVIDVLINPMMFSLTITSPDYKELLAKLGVPFIQAMGSMSPYAVWKESYQGMSTMDVSYCAAQPEFDGALINVPVSTREESAVDPVTGALISRNMPIPDRIEKMVSLALNWAGLRKKNNAEKKIAVIFHHYPPRNDRIGCAAGLDSFASVNHLLERMKKEDYCVERIYETGDELAKELVSGMTCDQRWLIPEKLAERAQAHAGSDDFLPWHGALPESIREKMTEDWGEIPGDLFVHNGQMHFPGTINGNIFLTIQPPRGYLENIDKIYHDMYLSPPHHYLAYYRWIKHVFKADAVIHVGKHGSLEWLPGKALGLSEECYPDLSIMDLPNVYPYIINDPSEGTQAKRRSYCCIIDHLTPAFTNADLYEELSKVENLFKDYHDAKGEDPGKLMIIKPMIWEAVIEANLDKDLEISEQQAFDDFDHFLECLHAYLEGLADTMINDGLHTMGLAPDGERLVEFVAQLTRLPNGSVPSLREAIISAMGFDYDDLLENRGKTLPHYNGLTGGELIRKAHQTGLQMIEELSAHEFNPAVIKDIIYDWPEKLHADMEKVLRYIATSLVPDIRLVTEEIDATMAAFGGRFVKPGPSGAPTRGQADILPTGRNFYSVDPYKIPSPAAWEVGKKLGDALMEHYLKETGKYPETVGMILWGGSTMRSKGDDIAEIFYLMGVRPVWEPGSGNVHGVEIVPAPELKHPRLDISPRTSGFFRDAFPNLLELIDDAVKMVAALNEPPDVNLLRKNVFMDMDAYTQGGMDREDALREATYRVFSCPPGTYGAGVAELIESKNWETQEDLGENYIRYSSHAYGQGSYGIQKPKTYRNILSRMELTVKNEDTREYDMMSCTDFYNYYGGLITAVKTVRGELPFAVVGDSADPQRIKMRTTFEEAKHVFRSRLLNPKWLEGMKRHGYKGAGDISKMMDVALGWDATAEVVDDWMYEGLANRYALDPEMQKWMKDVNPYALQNILDKLLEAISRGMWEAGDEMESRLRDAYLEIEGDIEEVS